VFFDYFDGQRFIGLVHLAADHLGQYLRRETAIAS